MAQFNRLQDYLAVAAKRLADARELLAPPSEEAPGDPRTRHLDAAVYLAGYVVECSLKAYLMSLAPDAKFFNEALEALAAAGKVSPEDSEFLAGHGHDLRRLLTASGLREKMTEVDQSRWGVVVKWKPEWRYDPRHMTSQAAAKRLVGTVEDVYWWIEDKRQRL